MNETETSESDGTQDHDLATEVISRTIDSLRPMYRADGQDSPDSVMGAYPNPRNIVDAQKLLIDAIVPGKMSPGILKAEELGVFLAHTLGRAWRILRGEISRALPFAWIGECGRVEGCRKMEDPEAQVLCMLSRFYGRLPHIRAMVIEDTRAAYEGDPAALSFAEVQLGYPGLMAVISHRIAHELYALEVPVVPRIMSEWIHSRTGIDIHPGARIGHGFFIDHGTGVVIGETSVIGNRVKVYQGVTLGAKSFPLDENGVPIKHIKRHPTVEDDVVIYSNASILGGDVVIGRGSTIGGNVFLMESVPPNSFVAAIHPELHIKQNGAESAHGQPS